MFGDSESSGSESESDVVNNKEDDHDEASSLDTHSAADATTTTTTTTTTATTVTTISSVTVIQRASDGISSQVWPAATALGDFVKSMIDGDDYQSDLPSSSEPPSSVNTSTKGNANTSANLATLLEYISSLSLSPTRPLRVLELGSGVGLTSLLLAIRLPVQAIVTDLESAMPLLQENVDANASKIHEKSEVVCSPLCWGSDTDHTNIVTTVDEFFKGSPPDLILASDCVYWENLHDPLRQTLSFLHTAYPQAVTIIAGMRRWKRDTAFYASLNKKGTGMRCDLVREDVSVVEDEKNVLADEEEEGKREIMRFYAVALKK
jgi:hypothetical protein